MAQALSPQIRSAADKAVAPILLAAGGALDAPKVNPEKAKEALEKLGIPQTGKVIVTFAFNLCGTHDFLALERAARDSKAQLFVVYGNPNEPGLEHEKHRNKTISISVIDGDKVRPLNAQKIILAEEKNSLWPNKILPTRELKKLGTDLGLTIVGDETAISSANSALYENGKFVGIIANKSTEVRTTSLPRERSSFTLG